MDRRARLATLALAAVLVAACGPAAATLGGPTASPAGPTATPAPTDPASALRIADPWVLDQGFPEVRQQILDGLAAEGLAGAEIRHVTGPDGESAFLMATDAGLGADTDLVDYARRLSTSSGTGAAVETIGERDVALLQTDDVSIITWVEPPLLLAVYASDAATARTIAAAVIGAP